MPLLEGMTRGVITTSDAYQLIIHNLLYVSALTTGGQQNITYRGKDVRKLLLKFKFTGGAKNLMQYTKLTHAAQDNTLYILTEV